MPGLAAVSPAESVHPLMRSTMVELRVAVRMRGAFLPFARHCSR